jgi:hypothetical protein
LWHLKELASIQEQAGDDLIYIPQAFYTAMRKFVDNDGEFEDGDPALMVEGLRRV